MTNHNFETDSGDYHYITEGISLSWGIDGIACEIGTRRGGSLKYIIDAIYEYCPTKSVISIDPYGSIMYQGREGQTCRLDYTNQMKYECMANVYAYLCEKPVDFHFFDVEDTVFFERNRDGVDVYNLEHYVFNQYSFVFFDGPHYISAINREIDFFYERTSVGGIWIFDDCTIDFYDHDVIEKRLFELGFELIKKGLKKAMYRKC